MAIPVSRFPIHVIRGAIRAGLLAFIAAIALVLMLLVAGGGRAGDAVDPVSRTSAAQPGLSEGAKAAGRGL